MSNIGAPRYFPGRIRDWLAKTLGPSRSRRVRSGGRPFNPQVHGSELEALVKSTEGDFLAIGDKLQDYYRRSEEISRISASVAQLMTGDEMKSAIDGLRDVIGLIRELEDKSRRNATTLQRILAVIGDLNDHLSGFHNIVRSLRILSVSTKIESSRLHGMDMGFHVLAKEVEELALEIESKHSQLLATAGFMRDLVAHGLLKTSELETRQHVQTGIILDKTVSNLAALTEKHGHSSKCATLIAARCDSICRNIGEVVSSLQFHDITRQRIEHVKEALESVGIEQRPETGRQKRKSKHRRYIEGDPAFGESSASGRNGEPVKAGDRRKRLILAVGVCELQIAQLGVARDELVCAVDNILENLRGVADVVSEIAWETQSMAGTANATGDSFLSEVDAGFSAMTSAFFKYAEANRELSSIMKEAGRTLAEMSANTRSIESVREKMKIISLNSMVKACHIGDEGASLGVLAENSHRLSAQTRQMAETVSGDLRSMTFESETLCGVGKAQDEGEGNDLQRIQELVDGMLTTLRNVNQQITTLLAGVHEKGLNLSNEILKAVKEVDVHRRVGNVIDAVISSLNEMPAPHRSSCPMAAQAVAEISALENSYTMDGEREVHSALLAKREMPVPPGSSPPYPLANLATFEKAGDSPHEKHEEDLGGNVELF
jgi:hypothetical protein